MEGWEPPTKISEHEYKTFKHTQDPTDPATAFIGFGCSFMGKWYGTFARSKTTPKNFARAAATSCAKKIATLKAAEGRGIMVSVSHADYEQYVGINGAVIYLDPPYAGRTPQSNVVGAFDHDRFWDVAKEMSKYNVVLVTEFKAPPDGVYSTTSAIRSWVRDIFLFASQMVHLKEYGSSHE